jgi:hypothetical protein
MDKEITIYMDCCCLNRPADDQTQDKIRIETDAIIAILFKCYYGSWKLIGSDVIKFEILKTPDLNKRNKALNEKLGPLGMIEFMQQFDSGYGDYTKERHNWLNNLTIEDIQNELKNKNPRLNAD